MDWENIAKTLEERGMGSGGSVQRLARLMGILSKDNQIVANIPNVDRSAYSQERYKFLLTAPFNVSNKCCNIFKKNMSHKYNRKNKMHPILGSMASESRLRTQKWLDNGCNGFDLKEPVSNPMSFWFDNDVLMYIKKFNIPLCSVYGDVVLDSDRENQCEGQLDLDLGTFDSVTLTTTGCLRSGCVGCGFGLLLEKRPNRLEMIDKVSYPKLRDFVLRGGAFNKDGLWMPNNNGLGFWFVHKYIALALKKELFIPEYDRYEKEFGNELTEQYLKEAKCIGDTR